MVRRTLHLPLGLLVAALSACGGTDNGRPSGKGPDAGAAALPCDAADGYSTQVFIDFEGELRPFAGYPDLRTAAVCDAVCSADAFYFNFDEAHSNEDPAEPCGFAGQLQGCDCQVAVRPDVLPSTDPAVAASLYGREIDGGGRCGVPGKAMHVQATNIANCYGSNGRLGWGAGVDINLAASGPLDDGAGGTSGGEGGASGDEANPPGSDGYDARGWDGISFWARNGNPGTNSTFIISVSDPGTTLPPPGQPGCSDAETAPDAEKCDAFGVAVTLTEEWTFVPALFRAMRQKGFGKPSPLGYLDTGNIVKIQLLLGRPGDWDVWIDDVAFFREPEASE
jgi:hypothetical protein